MTEIQCFKDPLCLKCENVVWERFYTKYSKVGMLEILSHLTLIV